jgi:putative oxidoreductase
MNLMTGRQLTGHPAIILLRVGVAALLFVHGVARAVAGGVAPFGEYLTGQGFPLGLAWAWAVTVIEIVGTPVMAAGRFVMPLAAYFILQLALGIVMVHGRQGWFVVGLGRNGVEYSVLLIVCLLSLALVHWGRERGRGSGAE